MKTLTKILPFTCVAISFFSTPALPHHSHAMYEPTQRITLKGTVSQLQWNNPHVFLYINAEDENGEVGNWTLEGGAPAVLLRQGWPSEGAQPGDAITVTIRPLLAGTRGGLIRTVTFADGSVFTYEGGGAEG